MCTGIQVISKQNNTYWGRTQEFDTFLPVCGVLVPRGTAINHMLSPIVAKNAAAGISLHDSNQDLLFMDGMNEHGLVGGSFYYGNDYSDYAPTSAIELMGKQALRGEEFVTWALLNCDSIVDLHRKAIKEVAISNEPNIHGNVIPQHYVFVDRTGASIVLEPSSAGSFDIYPNEIGTFTNQPEFPWHVQNLQNYVSMNNQIYPSRKFGKFESLSSGTGNGLFGLPGDYTPQSRFVRATVLNNLSNQPNDDQALDKVFRVLNTFDIPYGLIVDEKNQVQYTQYTSAYDLENRTVNISTYENRQIQQFYFDPLLVNNHEIIRYEIKRKQMIETMNKL